MIDGKRKSYIIAMLRRASYRWPPKAEAMKRARVGRGLYTCAICQQVHKRFEIQCDHIVPIVPTTGWDGFENFIDRLFCEAEGYQILCKMCHGLKTKTENTERRTNVGKVKKRTKRK